MHVPLVLMIALFAGPVSRGSVSLDAPAELVTIAVTALFVLLLAGRTIADLWTTADVDETTRVYWLIALFLLWGPALAAYWWLHVRGRGPARLRT